jgi:arginyl-tRNA synthetase
MIRKEAIEVLKLAGIKDPEKFLEIPPQTDLGDIAFPCFELAKKEKKNPKEIAKKISKKIKTPKDSLIQKIETKDGYVNFFFDWKKIAEKILKEILTQKENFGKNDIGKGKKVLIEYSHPNPVHPIHIGHARSTFLGDSLAKIFNFSDYKIIRANYMNNTGLQVAKLVIAYLLWGRDKKPKGKPDLWLWDFYIRFHEEAEKNPDLEAKAREILRKFEIEHDKEIVKVWNQVVEWCVRGFKETYKNLGIDFDVYFYENDFRDPGKKIVKQGLKKGIAFKSEEEAVVADLEKHGLPSLIILRSDGTGLYYTSDLGLTAHKFEKYKLDEAIWVVSTGQNLWFKQLFKFLELLGYPWIKNCRHFSFELVHMPKGKMSSREGRAIMLDEVTKKLTDLAYGEVKKRNPKISEKLKKEIAKKIGIGALKYNIIRIEPHKTITFDWKRMLSFEGNTGPYLQYAHTRCLGILKKAKKWRKEFKIDKLTEEEKQLVKQLVKFSEVVEEATKNLRLHLICDYAYGLATIFSNFYQSCPVLKATGKMRNFRLALVSATEQVLKNSLSLIGIEVPEKM